MIQSFRRSLNNANVFLFPGPLPLVSDEDAHQVQPRDPRVGLQEAVQHHLGQALRDGGEDPTQMWHLWNAAVT